MAPPGTVKPPSRRWLPDAELDAHPVGSWLLQLGFDLWIRACYRRTLLLPRGFHVAPGTLIASNHQRDVDGPLLGTVLVQRRALRFAWPLPFFATREDLFRPGILTRLTVHWPRPLSVLLGHIGLAWFFPLGRAEPMRRVREFTFGEALAALTAAGLGDAGCATTLNARGLRELDAPATYAVRDAAAHAALATLESWWGLRRLRANARAAIAPAFRATIASQIAHFAERLNRGRCVYFAPEGSISMDGHFGRIRGGFHRLVQTADIAPWIQPMALGYDALAPGRTRVVVHLGHAFRANRHLDRRAFDATVRQAILVLVPVTPSHLLAHFLLRHAVPFTQVEFATWLARAVAALRARRITLDPLLSRERPAQLADQRLRWLECRGLVVRRGEAFVPTFARDVAPGWEASANTLRYLANNLADLVPDIDRVLPC